MSSKLKNVLSILVGALLMGLLWRIRGTGGWGSSWGLLNAGAVFMLFVVIIAGPRKKLNLGWIGVSSLAFMLTVPTWGTFLSLMTGILSRTVDEGWAPDPNNAGEFIKTAVNIQGEREITVLSAVIIMLILGFGLATLWGIMLGRGFSNKRWRIFDFVILVAVFFVAMYVSRATLAHTLAKLIQPEALDLFKEGLFRQGLVTEETFESVYKVYMEHFDDMSWAKRVLGGRHYFALVETISIAIGGIASMIATRFVIKDKIASSMGLITSSAFAVAITVADLFFYFGNGGYHGLNANPFDKLSVISVYPWSCWEYFTGFIAGAIITTAVVIYNKKYKSISQIEERAFSNVPKPIADIFTFLIGFACIFGINMLRPIIDGRFEDSKYLIIAIIVAAVITVGWIIFAVIKYGIHLEKTTDRAFAAKGLLVMLISMFVTYFFTGFASNEANILSLNSFHNVMMVISFVGLIAYAIVNVVLTNKEAKQLKK